MASKAETALAKFRRAKDKVRTLDRQLEDARLEAARACVVCVEAGVKRTPLAEEWGTNVLQIDRMIARARAERR
jgi:hypothetical protein